MALPDLRYAPGWHSSRPPGTATAAYGGHYRLYARADTQGIISVRTIADDQEVRRIASDPITEGDNLFFSPDERFLLGSSWASARATRCACGAWPTGNRCSGTSLVGASTRRSARMAGVWPSPSRSGSSASTWRRARK
jgi:hypothetical protein